MKKISKILSFSVAFVALVTLTGIQGVISETAFAATSSSTEEIATTANATEYVDITEDDDGNILASESESAEKTAIPFYPLNSDGSVPDDFLTAYEEGSLPAIYKTNFIFNGVGAAVRVSESDDDSTVYEAKAVKTNVLNINNTGKTVITGSNSELTIAVNTNGVTDDIDLVLNGVSIKSNKKAPAIMVYNKDITYDKCNVTIATATGTENTITGGKLKKVSSMLTDNVETYNNVNSQYGDTSNTLYYISNSDGTAFSSESKDKILFAECTADSEKIADGDPYTYYKYSGAISSDIDLNFIGAGKLTVSSLGDEGIETKGDINMTGKTGDYIVTAYDDCLNASTSGTEININVNSLTVQVLDSGDSDAEGDGIDSNGSITIDGGRVCAYSHPNTADSGLDAAEASEVGQGGSSGIYINGGTVVSTSGSNGMMSQISNDSKQMYATFAYSAQQKAETKTVLKDTEGNVVFEVSPLNAYQSFVYSSDKLQKDTTYRVYCNDTLQQGYLTGSSSMNQGGSEPSQQPSQGENGGNNQTPPSDQGSGQQTQSSDQGNGQQTPTENSNNTNGQPANETATTLFTLTESQNAVSGLTDATDETIANDQNTLDAKAVESKTVADVKAASTATTYPVVSWTETEGVDGYQIQCTYENSNGETTTVLQSVSGKNTYTFATLVAGRTYEIAVRPYVTVNDQKVYGSWSSTVSVKVLADSRNIKTNIAKAKKITNLKATSKKARIAKVTWSKTSGVTGYQLVYSYKNSKSKKVTKTVTTKNRSYTVKKLTSKKTCTVKVRAYTTINNSKVYGSFKTVKVKIK